MPESSTRYHERLQRAYEKAKKAGDEDSMRILERELRSQPNRVRRLTGGAPGVATNLLGGVAEPVLSAATGAIAQPLAAMDFYKTLGETGSSAKALREYERAMSAGVYEPRSAAGRAGGQLLSDVTGAPSDLSMRGALALGASPEVAGAIGFGADTAVQAGLGAAGGALGGRAAQALNRMHIPHPQLLKRLQQRYLPVNPNARGLAARMDRPLTPGQLLGGGAKRIEEHLTSWPWIGSRVQRAHDETVESFQRATLNPALEQVSGRRRPAARGPQPAPPVTPAPGGPGPSQAAPGGAAPTGPSPSPAGPAGGPSPRGRLRRPKQSQTAKAQAAPPPPAQRPPPPTDSAVAPGDPITQVPSQPTAPRRGRAKPPHTPQIEVPPEAVPTAPGPLPAGHSMLRTPQGNFTIRATDTRPGGVPALEESPSSMEGVLNIGDRLERLPEGNVIVRKDGTREPVGPRTPTDTQQLVQQLTGAPMEDVLSQNLSQEYELDEVLAGAAARGTNEDTLRALQQRARSHPAEHERIVGEQRALNERHQLQMLIRQATGVGVRLSANDIAELEQTPFLDAARYLNDEIETRSRDLTQSMRANPRVDAATRFGANRSVFSSLSEPGPPGELEAPPEIGGTGGQLGFDFDQPAAASIPTSQPAVPSRRIFQRPPAPPPAWVPLPAQKPPPAWTPLPAQKPPEAWTPLDVQRPPGAAPPPGAVSPPEATPPPGPIRPGGAAPPPPPTKPPGAAAPPAPRKPEPARVLDMGEITEVTRGTARGRGARGQPPQGPPPAARQPSARRGRGGQPRTVPDTLTGHEAVSWAYKYVNRAFERSVNALTGDINSAARNGPSLAQEIAGLRNAVNAPGGFTNPEARTRALGNLDRIERAFGQGGRINGRSLQTLVNELRNEREFLLAHDDPQMRDVGMMLREVDEGLTRMIYRVNGRRRAENYMRARTAWSIYKSAENAAAAAGNAAGAAPTSPAVSPGGVPSAARYLASVRAADPSRARSRFARGVAGPQIPRASGRGTVPLQQLAEQGKAVLGNRYPDSGTAGRHATLSPWAHAKGLAARGALGPLYGTARRAQLQRWLLSPQGQRYLRANPQLARRIGQALGAGVRPGSTALAQDPDQISSQGVQDMLDQIQVQP